MKRILLSFLLLAGWASATIRNTDGTAANTATQITACVSGDTVLFPASGSFTWDSTGVTIPATKGIIIDYNGSTVNQGTGTSILFTIETNAVTGTRLTNGTINLSATPGTAISISTSAGSAASFANVPPRIDHMTIQCPQNGVIAIPIKVYFNNAIFDHCTIAGDDASEMIQNHGYSVDTTSNLGWTVDIVQGSSNAVYVEDSTFSKYDLTDPLFRGTSAVQNYYGARLVFRNNTLNYCQFDVHGTPGHVGGRWWEFYNNNIVIPANPPGHDQSDCADLRAGSGVLFGNTMSGGVNTGAGNAKLREEDTTGYPALWQIGRGKNTVNPPVTGSDQVLDPVYCWNNDFKTGPFGQAVYVIDGRDFYSNTVKPGYQPYKYPIWGAYPTLVAINAAGTQMAVTWDTACTNGATGGNGMALTASGGAVTATYSSGSGTTAYVYTLSRTILLGETITLAYTQPGTGIQVAASGTQQTLTDVGSWPQSAGSGTFFAGAPVTNGSTQGVIAGVNTGKLRGALQ